VQGARWGDPSSRRRTRELRRRAGRELLRRRGLQLGNYSGAHSMSIRSLTDFIEVSLRSVRRLANTATVTGRRDPQVDASVRGADFSWPKMRTFGGHECGPLMAISADLLVAMDTSPGEGITSRPGRGRSGARSRSAISCAETSPGRVRASRDCVPTVPTLSSAALRRLHSGGRPTWRFPGCGSRRPPTHELSVAVAVAVPVVIHGRKLQVPAGWLGRTPRRWAIKARIPSSATRLAVGSTLSG
jgi:hypothetical protein